MSTVTKKGQVTIPKPYRDRLHINEGDSVHFEMKGDTLVLRRKERKSLLSLGGIAKERRIGTGNERGFTKKAIARKIAREGV